MAMRKTHANDAPVNDEPVSMFVITKVIHEKVPFQTSSNEGVTLGSLLDQYLSDCASSGETVQGVELVITPYDWGNYVANAQGFKFPY